METHHNRNVLNAFAFENTQSYTCTLLMYMLQSFPKHINPQCVCKQMGEPVLRVGVSVTTLTALHFALNLN